MTLELSRDEARAIAVRAAWLADARPDGLIDMVRRLGALRIELPVLHHDRLIGKVDATAEHAEGALRVDAVHEDTPFDAGTRAAVGQALEELADRLGLEVLRARG